MRSPTAVTVLLLLLLILAATGIQVARTVLR